MDEPDPKGSSPPPESKLRQGWAILAWQAAGAAGWATFISVVPALILVLSAILWLPLLVFCERRRSRRHGFLPGIIVRVGIAGALITSAAVAPLGQEDTEIIEPLPGRVVTLDVLKQSERFEIPRDAEKLQVTLPSARPRMREVVEAIEKQTGLRCEYRKCGCGMSVLWGSHVVSVAIGVTP